MITSFRHDKQQSLKKAKDSWNRFGLNVGNLFCTCTPFECIRGDFYLKLEGQFGPFSLRCLLLHGFKNTFCFKIFS